jgi:hypothetical protein
VLLLVKLETEERLKTRWVGQTLPTTTAGDCSQFQVERELKWFGKKSDCDWVVSLSSQYRDVDRRQQWQRLIVFHLPTHEDLTLRRQCGHSGMPEKLEHFCKLQDR